MLATSQRPAVPATSASVEQALVAGDRDTGSVSIEVRLTPPRQRLLDERHGERDEPVDQRIERTLGAALRSRDRPTLTCDRLQALARRLGLRLFAEADEEAVQPVTARRSLGDIGHAVRVETPNYDYYYLCTELRRKRMIPAIIKIRARSVEQSAISSGTAARSSDTC